jgi:hypothetical protein
LNWSIVATTNIFDNPHSVLQEIGRYCPTSSLRIGFTIEAARR